MNRHATPDPLAFDWRDDPEISAMIEERVAERAEIAALKWRLRLITIETFMMAGLVIVAGLALGQPTLLVIRSGLIVAGACFASGMLLIGLSGACGVLMSRIRRWRGR
jgi:hypothetical protein